MQSFEFASRRGFRTSALAAALVIGAAFLAIVMSPSQASAGSYCGTSYSSGVQCYEGGGYQNWRYHQASLSSASANTICARSWTGSNYRTGSGCLVGGSVGFYSFCNYYNTPAGNSSVEWTGSGTRVLNGYVDSSTSHGLILSNNGC